MNTILIISALVMTIGAVWNIVDVGRGKVYINTTWSQLKPYQWVYTLMTLVGFSVCLLTLILGVMAHKM